VWKKHEVETAVKRENYPGELTVSRLESRSYGRRDEI